MRQISRRMEMIHPTMGWRRYEQRLVDSLIRIMCSLENNAFSVLHCHGCLTLLCYNDSRFFLPLEQSCTALVGN